MLRLALSAVCLAAAVATAAGYAGLPAGTAADLARTLAVLGGALLLDAAARRIVPRVVRQAEARFVFLRLTSYLAYAAAGLIVVGIWIEQTQNVILALGFIGAGLSFALQRPVANVVGFLVLVFGKPYAVGDRIDIDGEAGDVIDVNVFHTVVMEVGKWTLHDQFTGRIKTVPNSYIFDRVVNNYSRDFGFIWEELMIPITYGSDLRRARAILLEAAARTTRDFIEHGRTQLDRMTYKYLFEPREVEPAVYVVPTDNWVELRLRFILDAHHRRRSVNAVYEDILERLREEKGIRVASRTTARVWDAERRDEPY